MREEEENHLNMDRHLMTKFTFSQIASFVFPKIVMIKVMSKMNKDYVFPTFAWFNAQKQ